MNTAPAPHNDNHDNNAPSQALVPYGGALTDTVQAIMNKFVAKKSATKYTNENVSLMLWLFDEDPDEYLFDWTLDAAFKAHEEDQESEKTTKSRINLRGYFKSLLLRITKVDRNCPLILEKVTFSVFSHYLTNRKGKMLSKSAYGGVRSALMYLHKISGYETPDHFKVDLSQFNRGINRKVAEEKQASSASLEEGKKPMSFEVYKLMAKNSYNRTQMMECLPIYFWF